MTRRGRGDDGTILILSIGFAVIGLLLVLTVVDASAVFLARRDLAAAVDGTAVAAAEQVDTTAVYAGGTAAGAGLPLDPAAVSAAVQRYVAATYPGTGYPGQQITGGVSADQRAVQVTGRRTISLPVYGQLTVTASATADSRTR